ncbi:SDR family oxidoreductase [Nannocystis punicea]|uniref:SDR family oxidoreductase n=1 Tax=Nannocystis punicea TaxID=2995304 RepID=A0ABY7HJX8_9BACT|nr:SDR family oxidoreductase [Nannocystis poenicansa]WAS99340.1 SDR family oxidoreductase [Nannocystis poenicansa]
MTNQSQRTLLVTGASGQLGRRVVELLLAAGERSVIAGSRTPAKLADLAGRGVQVREVDFDASPEGLAASFEGVDRLLLISTDAVLEPGRRIAQHARAIAAAGRAGVRHVVYTSLTNPGPESPIGLAVDHRESEAALAASGMSSTILRNNLYTESLLQAGAQALASGQLVNAAGEGAVGYVTREDCARAAAAALASAEESSRVLDVTGPELVTQAQLAAILSQLGERPVQHVNVTPAQLREGMIGQGLPPVLADVLVGFDCATAQGTLAVVSDAVEQLTGQRPTSAAEFLRAHRAALVGA